MKFFTCVVLPALVQLLLGLALIFGLRTGGSFAGLGVMLLGMLAIPLTALANWAHTRSKPALPGLALFVRIFLTSMVFPILGLALHLLPT